MRRIKVDKEHKEHNLKEKNDSLWKEHILNNLADMRQMERECYGKLDSLNKDVSQTVVELKKANRTLKTIAVR